MNELESFYKGKKVFITGHTGFKGAWLVKLLLTLGATVKGYALEQEINSLYNILKLNGQIDSICGDIRDLNNLKVSMMDFKPDIVIHLAAQAIVRESYVNPVETYSTNVMGSVNLMEAVRVCDSVKSVINVTTDKVYENIETDKGYKEEDKLCGKDPYSNSKSCSEMVTYSYKHSFFSCNDITRISTARAGNVIGGGDFSKDRIIPDCLKYAQSKEKIVVRNPNSIRPYQHVLDCIYGYLMLAKAQYQDAKYEGSYNFGPKEESIITTGKLVELFCEEWGNQQTWYATQQVGPPEANILKLDSEKAKSSLGWETKINIKESMKNIVAWNKIYFENSANIILETEKEIQTYLSYWN